VVDANPSVYRHDVVPGGTPDNAILSFPRAAWERGSSAPREGGGSETP